MACMLKERGDESVELVIDILGSKVDCRPNGLLPPFVKTRLRHSGVRER